MGFGVFIRYYVIIISDLGFDLVILTLKIL